ncbi:unnamed protein product [Durusdinium trenchii]|uniref:Uncharacterized protein n=1 Tax=Durusdinium trenchii TaxID=1381693 RepID=A0ABP0SR99_9DINO
MVHMYWTAGEPMTVEIATKATLDQADEPLREELLQTSRKLRSYQMGFWGITVPHGVPLELLQGEWWVPGMTLRSEASKYAGKQQFKEILQTSGESSILFISRLIKDTAYAAVKTAQVDEDGAIMLHDICLLWLWLRKKLEVGEYMKANLHIFGGKATDAESTVLPAVSSWVEEVLLDCPEVKSTNDHAVVMWINLPACGIIGVARYEYMITAVSNLLAKYRRCKKEEETTKEEIDGEVKDEDDGSDSNNENELGDQEDDTDVRDVRYKLEKDLSLKERNLKVRNITWVFQPDSIYGKRDGAITGVAVVYKEKNNIFLGTKGYKVGVVRDVIMSNKIELPNFPQYAPLVDALKGPADDTETRPAKKIKISSEETCGEDQISSLAKTKLSINGAADLITDEGGDCLFLASRAHNTFTAFREMLFDCNPKFVAVV